MLRSFFDKLLVIEGVNKVILDIPLLLLFRQEVALVSHHADVGHKLIHILIVMDPDVLQLIDSTSFRYCLVHLCGKVLHEGLGTLLGLPYSSRYGTFRLPVLITICQTHTKSDIYLLWHISPLLSCTHTYRNSRWQHLPDWKQYRYE